MNVSRGHFAALSAALLLLSAFPAAAEKLRIADAVPGGDTAVRQLALSEGLADPALEISVRRVEPEEALRQLAAGETDLALLERSRIPAEFRGGRRVYAVEALAFYLNANNPVAGFSRAELETLFRAARPAWSDYTPEKLTDVQRFAVRPGRPDADRFERLFFADGARHTGIFELGSASEVLLIVAANPEAVGAVLYRPEAPVSIRVAAVDGVVPTLRGVTEGSYPLSFFREALTAAEPEAATRKFLEKLRSAAFYELLYEAGSLPADGGKKAGQ